MSADERKASFYLIVSPKGWSELSARLTMRAPELAADEVALSLSVAVPNTLFTRPQLRASIRVPADRVTPPVLDAAVLDNVRETLQRETGFDVTVALVEPEAP